MAIDDLRKQVFTAAMRLVPDGLSHGSQGNISTCDRETGLVAVTPSAIPYNSMKLDDIVVTDLDGKLVKGKWMPTSEIQMHTIFYRQRTEVNAVVHTHPPYASIFSIINQPIPPVLIEAVTRLTGPVPVAPYRTPGSMELAQIALDTMGSGVAAVLAQHGLITVGETLDQAYESTMAAENTARVVFMARSMGEQVVTLDLEVQTAMRALYVNHYHPKAKPG